MWTCEKCGTSLEDNFEYCYKCEEKEKQASKKPVDDAAVDNASDEAHEAAPEETSNDSLEDISSDLSEAETPATVRNSVVVDLSLREWAVVIAVALIFNVVLSRDISSLLIIPTALLYYGVYRLCRKNIYYVGYVITGILAVNLAFLLTRGGYGIMSAMIMIVYGLPQLIVYFLAGSLHKTQNTRFFVNLNFIMGLILFNWLVTPVIGFLFK